MSFHRRSWCGTHSAKVRKYLRPSRQRRPYEWSLLCSGGLGAHGHKRLCDDATTSSAEQRQAALLSDSLFIDVIGIEGMSEVRGYACARYSAWKRPCPQVSNGTGNNAVSLTREDRTPCAWVDDLQPKRCGAMVIHAGFVELISGFAASIYLMG